MSLSEEFAGQRDELLRLVDAGAGVRSAAAVLGISSSRAYAVLRAAGRGPRRGKTVVTDEHRRQVLAVFAASGSVNRAAKTAGLSHAAARRVLVEAGVLEARTQPRGKQEARQRFLQLVGEGWSSARAAREVGIHPRTAQDWHRGVRKSNGTRAWSRPRTWCMSRSSRDPVSAG